MFVLVIENSLFKGGERRRCYFLLRVFAAKSFCSYFLNVIREKENTKPDFIFSILFFCWSASWFLKTTLHVICQSWQKQLVKNFVRSWNNVGDLIEQRQQIFEDKASAACFRSAQKKKWVENKVKTSKKFSNGKQTKALIFWATRNWKFTHHRLKSTNRLENWCRRVVISNQQTMLSYATP